MLVGIEKLGEGDSGGGIEDGGDGGDDKIGGGESEGGDGGGVCCDFGNGGWVG